ncbi:MAG: hypothetical protein ACXAC2_06260 [Candidatus Kariarchaeaceae archaeon]|jgi:hypothetical protein
MNESTGTSIKFADVLVVVGITIIFLAMFVGTLYNVRGSRTDEDIRVVAVLLKVIMWLLLGMFLVHVGMTLYGKTNSSTKS